jgi:hypothetical protein
MQRVVAIAVAKSSIRSILNQIHYAVDLIVLRGYHERSTAVGILGVYILTLLQEEVECRDLTITCRPRTISAHRAS